jgi:hypothetical protein
MARSEIYGNFLDRADQAKTFGGRQEVRMSWVPQRHWEFPCYSHTRDVIGPVFQPDCRLVAVTLPQGGINDEKK